MNAITTVFATPELMSNIYQFDSTYKDIFDDEVLEEIEREYQADGRMWLRHLAFMKQSDKICVGLLDESKKYKIGTIFKSASEYYQDSTKWIITKAGRKYYYAKRFQLVSKINDNKVNTFFSTDTKYWQYSKSDTQFDKEGYEMKNW